MSCLPRRAGKGRARSSITMRVAEGSAGHRTDEVVEPECLERDVGRPRDPRAHGHHEVVALELDAVARE